MYELSKMIISSCLRVETPQSQTSSDLQEVVHEWKGMGTGCLSYPPMPPIYTLVIIIVTTTFINSVYGCDLDFCWEKYANAQTSAEATSPNNRDISCIPLRTYYTCLINKNKGCHGNIRYHSEINMVKKQLKNKKCTVEGPVNNNPKNNTKRVNWDRLMCNYPGKREHKLCGLFGDPHLRTFNNEFQTCKIEGAWPLINNKHLTVQVTNDPVVDNGAATATSKLTIVIKRNEDCAADRFVMYQAQSDNLPGTFTDLQTTHYGPDKSVELIEQNPGKHVEIHLRYIDTKISIQRIGQYFTFAIKMPVDVVNSSENEENLELCVTGCPKSEQIHYQEFLANSKNKVLEISTKGGENIVMSRNDALELCRKAQLVDFYLDSCVFDLITTGDKNFTTAAYRAWQDSVSLMPNIPGNQENRTNLDIHDETYNHSSRTSSSLRIILLTMLCLFLQFTV